MDKPIIFGYHTCGCDNFFIVHVNRPLSDSEMYDLTIQHAEDILFMSKTHYVIFVCIENHKVTWTSNFPVDEVNNMMFDTCDTYNIVTQQCNRDYFLHQLYALKLVVSMFKLNLEKIKKMGRLNGQYVYDKIIRCTLSNTYNDYKSALDSIYAESVISIYYELIDKNDLELLTWILIQSILADYNRQAYNWETIESTLIDLYVIKDHCSFVELVNSSKFLEEMLIMFIQSLNSYSIMTKITSDDCIVKFNNKVYSFPNLKMLYRLYVDPEQENNHSGSQISEKSHQNIPDNSETIPYKTIEKLYHLGFVYNWQETYYNKETKVIGKSKIKTYSGMYMVPPYELVINWLSKKYSIFITVTVEHFQDSYGYRAAIIKDGKPRSFTETYKTYNQTMNKAIELTFDFIR